MLQPGFHSIPRGMIAAIVTSLEMRARPALRPAVTRVDWRLERIARPSVAGYRALYTRIGGDWLWFSRLEMDDAALSAVIGSPDVEVYRLDAGAEGEGFLELDFRTAGEAELAFFGVSDGLVGGTAARFLMNEALTRAWARPICRFWVHTCTFDHPKAIAFYERSGFRAFRQQVEIAPDPRLRGVLPRAAAAHVPMFPE